MPKDSTPRSFAAVMALSPGNFGAHGREHGLESDARIGGAADDLQQLHGAGLDLAHLQLFGLRMLYGFDDFRDDDAPKRRRGRLDGLEFEAAIVRREPSSRPLQGTSTKSRSQDSEIARPTPP